MTNTTSNFIERIRTQIVSKNADWKQLTNNLVVCLGLNHQSTLSNLSFKNIENVEKYVFHFRICTPLAGSQMKNFFKFFNSTDSCPHCLDDCKSLIIASKLSQAPFKRCDEQNLGFSMLCQMDRPNGRIPPLWGNTAKLGKYFYAKMDQ